MNRKKVKSVDDSDFVEIFRPIKRDPNMVRSTKEIEKYFLVSPEKIPKQLPKKPIYRVNYSSDPINYDNLLYSKFDFLKITSLELFSILIGFLKNKYFVQIYIEIEQIWPNPTRYRLGHNQLIYSKFYSEKKVPLD